MPKGVTYLDTHLIITFVMRVRSVIRINYVDDNVLQNYSDHRPENIFPF